MQVATEHLPRLSSLKQELEEQLDGIEGASVEDNRFSVSVHYRNVPEERLPEVFQAIDTVVSRYDQIRIGSGKKVVEFRCGGTCASFWQRCLVYVRVEYDTRASALCCADRTFPGAKGTQCCGYWKR